MVKFVYRSTEHDAPQKAAKHRARKTLTVGLCFFVASCSGDAGSEDPGGGDNTQTGDGDSVGSGGFGSDESGAGGGNSGGGDPGGVGGGVSGNSGGSDSSGVGGSDPGGSGGSEPGTVGGCQPTCGTHKWACWPMPNPASTGPNPASYAVSSGVVHDEVTCLDWEQTPSTNTFTAEAAIAHCESLTLGGHSDWRLPTRIEMTSIVDFTRSGSVDAAFTSASGFHKTGSNWILTANQTGAGQTCGDGDCAWAFNMSDGIVSNAYAGGNPGRTRCVRGNGSGESYSQAAVAPPNHYEILSANEARDNYTRLIWQRDGDASGLLSWADAVTYCNDLTLGDHTTWRLPTMRELATLVDEARVAPSINPTVFPDTHYGARSNNWYWASHQARNSQASWAVNFDDGFTGFNSGAAAWNTFGPSYAKCVRDE